MDLGCQPASLDNASIHGWHLCPYKEDIVNGVVVSTAFLQALSVQYHKHDWDWKPVMQIWAGVSARLPVVQVTCIGLSTCYTAHAQHARTSPCECCSTVLGACLQSSAHCAQTAGTLRSLLCHRNFLRQVGACMQICHALMYPASASCCTLLHVWRSHCCRRRIHSLLMKRGPLS